MKHYILTLAIILCALSGCEVQDSYDYEPANIDNNVYMTTWEYINQRQDVFSSLKQTIEHCGLEDMYKQTDKKYTYLLWRDDAFTRSGGIFSKYSSDGTVAGLDVEAVSNALLYHTVNGYYHALGTLSFDPLNVITLWKSQEALMTLNLSNSNDINYYSRIYINDNLGSSVRVVAVTSNLLTTNGVIHVLDREAVYIP